MHINSIYSGAGGLDIGFESAGFKIKNLVELDKWCCKTLQANRKWNILESDIHDIPSSRLGYSDILIGGPPCQPFSKSAYWASGDTKRLDDPRADTLSAFLRVLRDTKPRAFLIENVKGLNYKGKDEGFKMLKSTINKINNEIGTKYSFNWKVLNAADYGVPQIRERIFIIGCIDGEKFVFPESTHTNNKEEEEKLFGPDKSPWITAWDAIGDIENSDSCYEYQMRGNWADLLPSIPEGKNYLWHTDRGGGLPIFGWRRRFWTFLLKLSKSRPSWTIQAQPGSATGPFHWKNRKLTDLELCRLQTIPDNYKIIGTKNEIQKQVGNAVPSLLAEILALEIKSQFFKSESNFKKPKLIISQSKLTPSPEIISPVPVKYLSLTGKHPAHPGTGKGHLVKESWG